jgi:proteasome lid subunit RPN8/RPN11
MRGLNIDPDPESRYRMDGLQVLKALKPYGDDEDRHLVGIYHSHTRSIAYPSATDVERADFPRQVYVLISVRGPDPVIRAFRIAKEQKEQPVDEVPIVES